MLVSVVVLTYNSADTISRTLDSIIDQAVIYGDQVEIIIGDDYSTDNTRNILLDYSQKYPNLINLVFNEKNLGVVNNYFNLMSRCSGKYIMECAGDDYWLPDKMNIQIEYMEEHSDVGMCCGKVIKYYEDIEKYSVPSIYEGLTVDFDSLLYSNSIFAVTVCIRRDVVIEYISSVNPLSKNWIMEDYPMWLWISQNRLIHVLNRCFSVYRIRMESISHPNNLQKELLFLENTTSIREFYSRNEADKEIIRTIQLNYESELYLKYYEKKDYRKTLKKCNSNKSRIKFALSIIPGYFKILNSIRLSKNHEVLYDDITLLKDN